MGGKIYKYVIASETECNEAITTDANDAVTMYYMLQAAKSEYIKLERSLTDTEVKGWV
ncbi:MAG: hypothetical protein HWQ38_16025 [Nostoc sp. NMS7]|uniref:hypothetical protein n=1 Tax=Nostoc sp. NMS7 TaxID=2815391 RepID=UPI0025F9E6F7|nr:hypothetical protein [Nostoc sp. NMS7]MBN3947880.1 hypothetical protein [Nostoc sp. NMS7]